MALLLPFLSAKSYQPHTCTNKPRIVRHAFKKLSLDLLLKKAYLYSQQSQKYPPASQLHSLFLVKCTLNPPLLSPVTPPAPQWRAAGCSFLPLHSAFDSIRAVFEKPCSILSWGGSLYRSNGIPLSCNRKQHSVLGEGEKEVSGPIVSRLNSRADSMQQSWLWLNPAEHFVPKSILVKSILVWSAMLLKHLLHFGVQNALLQSD